MGTPAFEPERVLAGRYRLERRLGKGGMGTIWVAEHLVLQAPVAVKLIDRDALPDEETIGRFLREAKAAATLRSPHVVQILDYGMDEGVPFIVMELLEGENLSQRLRRFTRLSPAETLRVVTHVGRAVGRAHEAGIIHRDLKPENVFLVHNEDEEIAKVLDFGVAKMEHASLGEGTRTRTGSILGTPYYMSPEQAQGNKTVDHRSDLWSLGVIAYECLVGKRPFFSDGLGDLVLQICVRDLPVPSASAPVPAGFDAWFLRAVARDPDVRFQSAREMTETLREALGIERDASAALPESVLSSGMSRGRIPSLSRDAEANAPTVALEPEEVQRLAQSGVEEADEEFERSSPPLSQHVEASSPEPQRVERRAPLSVEPPPSGSHLSTVFAVAAAALALGMAGGLVALWQMRVQKQPAIVQTPIVTAAPEVSVRAPELTPPNTDDSTIAVPSSPVVTPEIPIPSASAPAPRTPSASEEPAASAAPRPHKNGQDVAADAGAPAPAPTTDAGWVKPAWAIPDEEPRRAPDLMQDERSEP